MLTARGARRIATVGVVSAVVISGCGTSPPGSANDRRNVPVTSCGKAPESDAPGLRVHLVVDETHILSSAPVEGHVVVTNSSAAPINITYPGRMPGGNPVAHLVLLKPGTKDIVSTPTSDFDDPGSRLLGPGDTMELEVRERTWDCSDQDPMLRANGYLPDGDYDVVAVIETGADTPDTSATPAHRTVVSDPVRIKIG